MSNPVGPFSLSYCAALLVDLDNVMEEQFHYTRETGRPGTTRVSTGEFLPRRPQAHECLKLGAFDQTWPNTACGFAGVAGQAFTNALTVVVEGPLGYVCVYFGGRLAYHIGKPNSRFFEDLAKRQLLEQRYGSTYRDE